MEGRTYDESLSSSQLSRSTLSVFSVSLCLCLFVCLFVCFFLQHYTFYDLIITKARGKSGPLFHFDVHDDVRLISDATIEKDESHPGKVRTLQSY